MLHTFHTLPTRSGPTLRVSLPGCQPDGVASAPLVSRTNWKACTWPCTVFTTVSWTGQQQCVRRRRCDFLSTLFEATPVQLIDNQVEVSEILRWQATYSRRITGKNTR